MRSLLRLAEDGSFMPGPVEAVLARWRATAEGSEAPGREVSIRFVDMDGMATPDPFLSFLVGVLLTLVGMVDMIAGVHSVGEEGR